MKGKAILFLIVLALIGGGYWFMRRSGGGSESTDPAFHHTAAGTHQNIQDFQLALADAFKRGDLRFIHDHMYFLQGLAQALNEKLEPAQRQQLAGVLAEFKRVTDEIDRFAARGNAAATEAGLQKLSNVVNNLGTQFKAAVAQ